MDGADYFLSIALIVVSTVLLVQSLYLIWF